MHACVPWMAENIRLKHKVMMGNGEWEMENGKRAELEMVLEVGVLWGDMAYG